VLVCGLELVKGPPGDLDDDVVDGRLERRWRLHGDLVLDLVQPQADRYFGRYASDGIAGRLAGQCG